MTYLRIAIFSLLLAVVGLGQQTLTNPSLVAARLGDFNVIRLSMKVLRWGQGCSASTPCSVQIDDTVTKFTSAIDIAHVSGSTGTLRLYVDASGNRACMTTSGLSVTATPLTCSTGSAFPANSIARFAYSVSSSQFSAPDDLRAIFSRNSGGGSGTITCAEGVSCSTVDGVTTIGGDVDAMRTGIDNVLTGSLDASASTGVIVRRGSGAPSSGACDASAEVGGVYVRSDGTTFADSVYFCVRTSATPTYGWVLAPASSSSNLLVMPLPNLIMTSPAGLRTGLPVDPAYGWTNSGGIITMRATIRPGSASVTTPTIKFKYIAEDDQTNAAGFTVTLGCLQGSNTAITNGTPTSVTITPSSGSYRRLQEATISTVSLAGACAVGDVMQVKMERDSGDANTSVITLVSDITLTW